MHCWLIWAAALAACAQAQNSGVIAYTHAPDGGPPWPVQDVYTVAAGGGTPQALTRDGQSHDPSWSPDGGRIFFIHDAENRRPVELSVMDADGRNRRVLRVIEPVIYSAACSPDGKALAVSAATSRGGHTGLYILPADGKGNLRLIITGAWQPAWSPDGTKLAFTVERPRGRWAVHVANSDGTDDIRLTDSGKDSGSPVWSPDGSRIAFDQFTDANRRQQIFIMNADGSSVRQLTRDPAWSCAHPAWSPGGDQLVIACRSAGSPCGMGFFSTGQPMPECTRRLFILPVRQGASARPAKLLEHDAATPSFGFQSRSNSTKQSDQ